MTPLPVKIAYIPLLYQSDDLRATISTGHKMMICLWKLAAILMLNFAACEAAKILLIAPGSPSHLQQVYVIGKQLVKSGRHEITVLVPKHIENSPILTNDKINVLTYKASPAAERMDTDDDIQKEWQKTALEGNLWAMLRNLREFNYEACTSFLKDQELFAKVKAKNFDFAIIDGISFCRCMYFMAYRLNIPYATVVTVLAPDMMSSVLNLPSIREPLTVNAVIGDDEGTFVWRVKNALKSVMFVLVESFTINQNQFAYLVPERPPTTVEKLARDSKIWLIDSDSSLDAPQPIMPHVFQVGGLSISKPKQLESKFKAIADKATDSLVLISFGGNVKAMDDEYYNKIYEALKKLPQFTFIWKIKQHPKENPPKNVHIFDWIPQREILAHKNVVLFITHCGNAGQYEALYSAVPMLGIPFFGDQHSNAIRMFRRGFGQFLDLKTFTTPMLTDMIVEMTLNPRYKRAIRKASALYWLKEPAIERAAKAIEHVLEHGSDHLRSPAVELEWYQLLMWDVALFLLIVTLVVIFIIGFCLSKCYKCCRRYCCRSGKQKRKQKQR
ncbi:UDP-glucuronosyltransferase 2C1-like [Tubulanus polymorphus]|uniref:UDP-glucuronosyltransferase 2C1-like n=1 Tax=Tubulanus polymorphus TaxID=672921 RepID=UPI003DA4E274